MRVISIANQRSLVGKTITATNLAAGFALRGHKTLLIDLDWQCNATLFYLPRHRIKTTLADILVGYKNRLPITDAIYETHIPALYVVPSHIRLAMIERQTQIEHQYRLKDFVESAGDYEFVIIDCPPNLGMASTQALLASSDVIMPVTARHCAIENLIDFKETVGTTMGLNPNLRMLGYLITQFDRRNTFLREILEFLEQVAPPLYFETIVRYCEKLRRTQIHRRNIFEYAPTSSGCFDYEALTSEVLEKLDTELHST